MLNDFLAPLEESVLNYIDSLPLLSVGKNLFFNDKNLDLSKIDIALKFDASLISLGPGAKTILYLFLNFLLIKSIN